ncbi:hypothetical protein BGZ59_010798 [Podila verticillata]|nr:hypothetical protein BGZ59_010798 [Podila verticillata]
MAQYTPERAQEIADNLTGVQSKMEETLRSITNAQKAQLVAVSKYKPASDILAAYEKAGHRHFGENYVQELEEKSKELPGDIKWHFIGTLQSNKCKTVAAIPNLYVVETVDSAKKASTLDKACASRSEPLRIFLQMLNECRAIIQESLKIYDLGLSMGMSDDFPRALLQGSTNIRVGSTIFGSRPPFTKST